MPDELDRLRRLRPPTAADDDWTSSPAGQRSWDGISRGAQQAGVGARPGRGRLRSRPALLITGAVLAAGVATAAAVTITASPVEASVAYCLKQARPDADAVQIKLREPSAATARRDCDAQWETLYPTTPRPAGFAVCVYPYTTQPDGGTGGGGQAVIPTTETDPDEATACTAAGLVPLTPS